MVTPKYFILLLPSISGLLILPLTVGLLGPICRHAHLFVLTGMPQVLDQELLCFPAMYANFRWLNLWSVKCHLHVTDIHSRQAFWWIPLMYWPLGEQQTAKDQYLKAT